MTMSDTTSPPSVHLHPLSPSSSMSSTDSAPQSEPTSDEQPDLGAFTTVLRAWTYLQPPPRIPVQIHSPTTSTTTTFQPDQSVVDSDFQNSSQPPAHPPSTSSFTRPPSSSVLQEESTVWNHAPIASYLYSPNIERIRDEDDNSVGSTEGGRTVEINSELSFDDRLSSVPSLQPQDPDVAVPVPLVSDSSALNPLSYSSTLSYQIPDISEPDQVLAQRTVPTSGSLKSQRTVPTSGSLKSQRSYNSVSTTTFCPPVQQQHRTVLIHPPTQTISDDASVSHLSLPPLNNPSIPTNPNPNPYLPQQQPPSASLPPSQPPRLGIETSTSTFSLTRGIDIGGGRGTIIVDDLSTPDQTPESFAVDWKRGGRNGGGFRPVDDDREEQEAEAEKRGRAYGYGLGFGFARVQQRHVSGYTSNYEGSQSSFRARKSSEMKGGRSTRLEPQNEDNEDSNIHSDIAEHYQYDDEDQDRDDEEDSFSHFRRYRGRFHSQSHTLPRGVLPSHPPPLPPPPQQQSIGQTQTQTSMEGLRDLAHDHSQPPVHPHSYAEDDPHQQQLYSHHHLDLQAYPDPYPRPHARPFSQDRRDRDIYSRSSHSSMSPVPTSSSPSYSHIELSPIQRDYVLIQPQTQMQTQLPVSMQLQLQLQPFSQHSQSQPQQSLSPAQAQTSHPNSSYLSTQIQGLSFYSSTTMTTATTTALVPVSLPPSLPPSAAAVSIPPSVVLVSNSVPLPSAAASMSPSGPTSSSYSNSHQGQSGVANQHHNHSPLLSSSSYNKDGLPPPPSPSSVSSPSALLSKTIEKVLEPDKAEMTDNLGKPEDKPERAGWECVDLEEYERVSISGRSSNVGTGGGGGGGLGSAGGSGLGVGSGSVVDLDLGQPSPKVQQSLLTKQQQLLTKHPSMKQFKQQQQRRQLELQFQQSDVQARPHVESDSGGSEREGTSTVGASVLVSELQTTTTITTAPITIITISKTTDSQPSIPHSIAHSIPNPNPNPNPNPKPHTRTNSNHSKHSHCPYHSDSHVAHMEDTTGSELDDDLSGGGDIGVSVGTVRQFGGTEGGDAGNDAGSDALLPSLGYLDEALSFIAAERAKWSAAREGVASGSGSAGAEVTKGGEGGGKRTEDWKILVE
ncbi:hypothetical protein BYT27DRAFT_6456423 [Phlegmacium glaucopus]|nr:hypothetical protein BYT27DRAFT_6456423 [Phlegmacium glaucopus]